MELRHLRVFVAAAEELNFGRTAARLFLTPPAVSRTIAQLERQLGTTLFERTSRHVELTDAGRRLVELALPLIGEADAIVAEFSEQRRVRDRALRVGVYGAGAGELTAPILAAFRLARPDVELRIDAIRADVIGPLQAREVDVALVIGGYNDERITLRALFTEPRVLAVPYTHDLASASALSVADVLDQRFPHCTDDEPEHWKDIWAMVPEHDGDQGHREVFDDWPPDPAGQLAALLTHNVVLSIPATLSRLLPPGIRAIPLRDASPSSVSAAVLTGRQDDRVADFVAIAEQSAARLLALVPGASAAGG